MEINNYFSWILLYSGSWRGQGRPGLNIFLSSSNDWSNELADNPTFSFLSHFIHTDIDHPTLSCLSYFSLLYPHRQRSPYFVLLILLFPTLSTQTKIIPQGVKRRVPDHDLDRNRRPEASWTTRPVPGLISFSFCLFLLCLFCRFVFCHHHHLVQAGGGEREDVRQDGRERRRVDRVQRVARLLPPGWANVIAGNRLIDGFDGFENEIGCID